MITAVVLLVALSLLMQMLVLISAALIGMNIKKSNEVISVTAAGITTKGKINYLPLIIFAALLARLPLLSQSPLWLTIFADFYQSGSLVFGGGHVVLPMLQQALGEDIETDRFLLGYAAAQAVPGPMFSLSIFLGADLLSHSPFTGALIATVAIFLPGFLLVLSFHNAWESLAAKPKVAGAVWGINASVVGLLIAALYQPVFTSAILTPVDMAAVIVGFFVLRTMKVSIITLVVSFIAFGYLIPMFTN